MRVWKLIFLFLILSACNAGTKKENQQKQEKQDAILPAKGQEMVQDGTSLFDGKTLDGWEITSFGTQGRYLFPREILCSILAMAAQALRVRTRFQKLITKFRWMP